MKKLNKVLVLVASVALTTASYASSNWKNGTDELVWTSGSDASCWDSSFTTEENKAAGCKPEVVAVQAPVKPAEKPVEQPTITTEKVSFAADAFFDFDKATLKPQGKADLDKIAQSVADIDLEAVVAVGHADITGKAAYNQKLSERRAAAVKAYLVAAGVSADRVFIEGKGSTEPVADNATREGRAKNRRVVIEVVGTKNQEHKHTH